MSLGAASFDIKINEAGLAAALAQSRSVFINWANTVEGEVSAKLSKAGAQAGRQFNQSLSQAISGSGAGSAAANAVSSAGDKATAAAAAAAQKIASIESVSNQSRQASAAKAAQDIANIAAVGGQKAVQAAEATSQKLAAIESVSNQQRAATSAIAAEKVAAVAAIGGEKIAQANAATAQKVAGADLIAAQQREATALANAQKLQNVSLLAAEKAAATGIVAAQKIAASEAITAQQRESAALASAQRIALAAQAAGEKVAQANAAVNQKILNADILANQQRQAIAEANGQKVASIAAVGAEKLSVATAASAQKVASAEELASQKRQAIAQDAAAKVSAASAVGGEKVAQANAIAAQKVAAADAAASQQRENAALASAQKLAATTTLGAEKLAIAAGSAAQRIASTEAIAAQQREVSALANAQKLANITALGAEKSAIANAATAQKIASADAITAQQRENAALASAQKLALAAQSTGEKISNANALAAQKIASTEAAANQQRQLAAEGAAQKAAAIATVGAEKLAIASSASAQKLASTEAIANQSREIKAAATAQSIESTVRIAGEKIAQANAVAAQKIATNDQLASQKRLLIAEEAAAKISAASAIGAEKSALAAASASQRLAAIEAAANQQREVAANASSQKLAATALAASEKLAQANAAAAQKLAASESLAAQKREASTLASAQKLQSITALAEEKVAAANAVAVQKAAAADGLAAQQRQLMAEAAAQKLAAVNTLGAEKSRVAATAAAQKLAATEAAANQRREITATATAQRIAATATAAGQKLAQANAAANQRIILADVVAAQRREALAAANSQKLEGIAASSAAKLLANEQIAAQRRTNLREATELKAAGIVIIGAEKVAAASAQAMQKQSASEAAAYQKREQQAIASAERTAQRINQISQSGSAQAANAAIASAQRVATAEALAAVKIEQTAAATAQKLVATTEAAALKRALSVEATTQRIANAETYAAARAEQIAAAKAAKIAAIEAAAAALAAANGAKGRMAYETGFLTPIGTLGAGLASAVAAAGQAANNAATIQGALGGNSYMAAMRAGLSALGGGIAAAVGTAGVQAVGVATISGINLGNAIYRGTIAPLAKLGVAIGASARAGVSQARTMVASMGTMAIGGGILAAGGSLVSSKNIGEFEKASLKVAQLTKDQKGMEMGAQTLSQELKYGATSAQILKAGYETLSSGIEGTSNVMNVLRAATKATIASGGDAPIEKTNDAITTIINSYKNWGLTAKDAGSIVNQISGTVDAGKISYSEYSQQIGKVASIAAAAGVSFADLNAVIAQATIAGQRPEAVLSGLPGMISNIIKPSKDAKKAAEELGLQFDAQALRSKGLLPFLAEIGVRAKASGKDLSETNTRLFGSIRGRNAALATVQNPDNVLKLRQQTLDGNVDKNFNLASGGIKFKQEALQNRLIELDVKIKQGAIGNALAASLGVLAKGLDLVIAGIEKLDGWYKALSPEQKAFTNNVAGVGLAIGATAAAIVTGVAAFTFVGGVLGPAAVAVAGFATGLGALLVAIAPVAIPVAALGAAVYGLAKAFGATNTQAFTAALGAAGVALAAVFGPAVVSAIGAGVAAMVSGFVAIGVASAAALVPLAPFILGAVGVGLALAGLYQIFKANEVAIKEWATNTGKFFQNWFNYAKLAWDGVIGLFSGNKAKWNEFSQVTGNALQKMNEDFSNWANQQAKAFGDWVGSGLTSFGKWASGVGSAMDAAVASAFVGTGKMLGSFFNISGGIGKLGDFFKWLLRQADIVFPGTSNLVGAMSRSVVTFFDPMINAVKEMLKWFTELPNAINKAIQQLNIFNSTPQPNTTTPQGPAKIVPGEVKNPSISSAPSRGANSGNSVLVASDDLSGLGLGKELDKLASKPISADSVTVTASVYHPGGGGMEGKQKDYRGRRLTDNDLAVATPGVVLGNGLPYGTVVRVTNPVNGRSVEATARDSGPFVKGRNIDLTGATARAIGFSGVGPVKVEIVSLPDGAKAGPYSIGESKLPYSRRNTEQQLTSRANISPGPQIGYGARAGERTVTSGRGISSPIQGLSLQQAIDYVGPLAIQGPKAGRRGGRTHSSQDYPAPIGTPVKAAFDGTLYRLALDAKDGYGVMLTSIIDGQKVTARYIHLTEESVNRALKNPNVTAGEEIGQVGRHGRQGGNTEHLHFDTYINGVKQSDPRRTLATLASKAGARANNLAGVDRPESTTFKLQGDARTKMENLVAENEAAIAATEADIARYQQKVNRLAKGGRGGKARSEQLSSARSSVTNAQNKLAKLERTLAEKKAKLNERSATSITEEANKEIAVLQTGIDSINSVAKREVSKIQRQEDEGSITPLEAINRRNALVKQQSADLEQYRSKVRALRKKYPSAQYPAVGNSLNSITEGINNSTSVALSSEDKLQQTQSAAEIAPIQALIARANARASQAASTADYKVAIGELSTADGEQAKAEALATQNAELSQLLPKVRELWNKYTDPTVRTNLESIAQTIQGTGKTAAEAVASQERALIGFTETQISDKIAAQQNSAKIIDYQVSTGKLTVNAGATQKAEELNQLALELEKLIPTVNELNSQFKDEGSILRIRAMTAAISDQRIAANAASQAIASNQIKLVSDRVLAQSDKDQQEVKNSRLLGAITEKQEAEQILAIRLRTADSLDLLKPKLLELRAIQKDPAVIEALNEQLAKIQQYSAEATGAARAQSQLDKEATAVGTAQKQLSEALNDGFKSVFQSATKGFSDLGSVIDNLLGKVANIGFDFLFNSLLNSLGGAGIFNFKAGGHIGNYRSGGHIANHAAGGGVVAAIAISSALAAAMKKEGRGAVPIVANDRERVLNERQTSVWESAAKDGTWQQLERIYNYSSGGSVSATAPRATVTNTGASSSSGKNRSTASVTVSRINSIDYVSVEQLQQVLEVQMPLAARAGAAITEQNLAKTNWRNNYNL